MAATFTLKTFKTFISCSNFRKYQILWYTVAMKEPITVKPHLSVEAVEMRYCKAKHPVERSQWQIIWLPAQGKSSSSRLWRNRPRMGSMDWSQSASPAWLGVSQTPGLEQESAASSACESRRSSSGGVSKNLPEQVNALQQAYSPELQPCERLWELPIVSVFSSSMCLHQV